MNEDKVIHSENSVELYLPWNDTWIKLPSLPYLEGEEDRLYRSHILYLPDLSGPATSSLYLLGGVSEEWNTGRVEVTNRVWRMLWNIYNNTYFWNNENIPPLGR